MKKNIIALAIASAIAAPVAMADAPTIYGKLNLNIAKVDGQDATVNSTASRLGVKGSEDLGNGLKAVYKVEFGLDAVADNKDVLSARNQFLGLAGGFGTVLMGRHDTPTKMVQPSDLFNDGAADLGKLTNGIEGGEIRASDVLAYVSPSFGGVKIIAAAVLDGDNKSDAPKTYNDDWINIAATYGSTKEGLFASVAWQDADDIDATIVRAAAQYKAGGLIVNGLYQDVSGDTSEAAGISGDMVHLQAGYKMGKFMPKVKYVMADSDANGDEDALAIGLNYSLGKKTTAYIYTVMADDMNAGKTTKDQTIAGMVHKF